MFGSLFELKGPITPKLPLLKGQPIYEVEIGENKVCMVLPPHNPFYPDIHKELAWSSVINFQSDVDSSQETANFNTGKYLLDRRTISRRYWKLGGTLLSGSIGQVYLSITAGAVTWDKKQNNLFNALDFLQLMVDELYRANSMDIQRGRAYTQTPLEWRWVDNWKVPAVKFNSIGGGGQHFVHQWLLALDSNQFLRFGFVIEERLGKHPQAVLERAPIFEFIEKMMSFVSIELSESAKEKLQLAPAYVPGALPIQPPLHFTTPEQDRFAAWESLNSSILHLYNRVPWDHPLAEKLFEFQKSLKVDSYRKPEEDGDYSLPEGVPEAFPADLEALYQEYKDKPSNYVVKN